MALRTFPLVVITATVLLSPAAVFAQERGVEVHAGIGYVFDPGGGPSVPAVNPAVVAWLTPRWGIGARLTVGVADDYFYEPIDTILGVGDLRVWTVTSQWRWFARGTEVHVGLGAGRHEYRHARSDGTAQPIGNRSGHGFAAIDLLLGRHVRGPLHVKGGFTLGLGWNFHPVQPVVMLAWKL
jgi:hypothetical protein